MSGYARFLGSSPLTSSGASPWSLVRVVPAKDYHPNSDNSGERIRTTFVSATTSVIRVCRSVFPPASPHGDSFSWEGGKDPIGAAAAGCYLAIMNLILLIVVLLLLFGGGGFYFGGPVFGGGGIGLVLLICLIIFLMGGFRSKTSRVKTLPALRVEAQQPRRFAS